MPQQTPEYGWRWFEQPTPPPEDQQPEEETRRAAERVFASHDGRLLLARLRQLTIDRRLGPNASDAEMRWLEAQRALVAWLEDQADATKPIIPRLQEQKEN